VAGVNAKTHNGRQGQTVNTLNVARSCRSNVGTPYSILFTPQLIGRACTDLQFATLTICNRAKRWVQSLSIQAYIRRKSAWIGKSYD
jgi:hypothetical protein